MAAAWFRCHADDACLTLRIHAQPNARSTGAAGLHGDALKIRVAAPAADDRANAALLAWLADALAVPRSTLRLKSGKTARRKVVEIRPAGAQLIARAAALAA
jgi:uncharacterized protein (TIGR00251 family)